MPLIQHTGAEGEARPAATEEQAQAWLAAIRGREALPRRQQAQAWLDGLNAALLRVAERRKGRRAAVIARLTGRIE